jgi:hypothetical protein
LLWGLLVGLIELPGSGAAAPPDAPISFRNDVMAVFAKSGCNAGTCHGNKNGKGGFKLSLRGQDPALDYVTLTRDIFARRVNPAEPGQSLILLKPSAQIAHEGGLRFATNSAEYTMLQRWIAGGMPNDLERAPRLEKLAVGPGKKIMVEGDDQVQIQVQALFSDGSRRDVSSLAVYEPANPGATIDPDGLVQRVKFGETTVLVRYLDRQEPVRLAFVPRRPDFRWKNPRPGNYVDSHVFAKMRDLRMNPASSSSDSVFVRRIYLDLIGLLPTAEEARTFVADRRGDKRARLIEQLLERPEFADCWALKWADLLRVEAHSLDSKGVQNFHHWIRQSVATNKPLDQFARELIGARGSTYQNPAANYYRPNRNPVARAKAVAQVFLGTRLQCAECHNHPFDRWTQDDYYDWARLFGSLTYKVLENKREIDSDQHEWNGEQIVFLASRNDVKNPRTGKNATPRFLGDVRAVSASQEDPLREVALWIASSNNLRFASVQANRVWYQLFGRGLVDPPDDFRATNPASHPELLEALAADFARHHFSLKYLIRLLANSYTYQQASEPDNPSAADEMNYSHAIVQRLHAEPLLDCQSQVAGVPLKFAGYPPGLRAAQLPGVRPESKNKRRANATDQFLEVFGKPPRLVSSDTERSCESNMGQALQLINGPTVQELLGQKENRLTRLLASDKSNNQILDELFWTALSRPPTPSERTDLLRGLDTAKDRRAELEDILWALLNSKEFLFRR